MIIAQALHQGMYRPSILDLAKGPCGGHPNPGRLVLERANQRQNALAVLVLSQPPRRSLTDQRIGIVPQFVQ